MRFPAALLWINTALFVVFGIGFLVAPRFLSLLVTAAAPGTASAMIDMRATYGGMSLGIGLFFGFCARQLSTVHLGLVASLLVLSGIAGARIVGMLVDGAPNALMVIFLTAELLVVALVAVALKGRDFSSSGATRSKQT